MEKQQIRVFFLGKPQNYWKSLQERYKTEYKEFTFEFHQFYPADDVHFQTALLEIQNFDPNILFLDYSTHPTEMLTMARTIKRCMLGFRAAIGLWEHHTSQHLIDESNTTGIFINHVKSPEVGEVAYQSLVLATEDQLKKHAYATVKFIEAIKFEFSHMMKVGYLTKDYFHLEHAIELPDDDREYDIVTDWKSIFEISAFQTRQKINKDFYYHYPYSTDVQYTFDYEFERDAILLKNR